MKVILKTDVHHVGRAGQILNVKDGYARNYLFPRKLAIPAESKSLKEWNYKKKIAELRSKKAQLLRNEIGKKMEGIKLSFQKPTTKQGKLFGSITLNDISAKLKSQGFDIDKKFIQLDSPIKAIGEYKVNVDLGESTTAIEISIQGETPKNEKTSTLSKLVKFSKSLTGQPSKQEEPASTDSSERK